MTPEPTHLDGIIVRPLDSFPDARGRLTEIFRRNWEGVGDPVEWRILHSKEGAVRGMNLYLECDSYFVVATGALILCLHDLRPSSPTHRRNAQIPLSAERITAVMVPAGVLHGTIHRSDTILLAGLSGAAEGDLGCHWSDPALGLSALSPLVTEGDASRPPLAQLERALRL